MLHQSKGMTKSVLLVQNRCICQFLLSVKEKNEYTLRNTHYLHVILTHANSTNHPETCLWTADM